ncbi:MAG TPA: VIT1/CCC1 family protein [Vicinamibacteria bacterium]|nr:VIT1/CCC1 family protein [Vicinamibacteria bacterium]
MSEAPAHPSKADLERYRNNYLNEMDGAALYRALAREEDDEKRRRVLERLAEAEERHARRWAELLRSSGVAPPTHSLGARTRILSSLARLVGAKRVLPVVMGLEAKDEEHYATQPEASGLSAEERGHRRVVGALAARPVSIDSILERERWHRRGAGGSLRAAVFGVSDGLVSNFSLVMGVAGASVAPELVLLSGIAGLLAGAFSMAAGEWVSVKAQSEMLEKQLQLEKEELEMSPEEEREELALIYQAKGIPEEEATALASRLLSDSRTALDTLAREELGLDPDELGAPWGAAGSSFAAFSVGAVVPLAPFFFAQELGGAVVVSAALSASALFLVGAALSVFTSRGALVSGARMLLIGCAAAMVTYAVGSWLGVEVSG